MPTLSRILKVNPRNIWRHEALDFTRWLAEEENISLLCDELQINIENVKTEAGAGRYSVDIVADEIESNRKVIIENQLEATDHKHLGQILTYASSFDASLIIWIVTDYTEEHRQAIDWFNRNMTDHISFFLVQIEIYQIGDSLPAPKFNIICEPNDWGKTIKKSEGGDKVSELKLLQQEFWEAVREYTNHHPVKLNYGRTPRPQHWYNISFGTSRCHLALTVNSQKGYVGCEVYIRNDQELYEIFKRNRDEIETAIGAQLDWMDLPDATASRVIITHPADIFKREKWDQYAEWLVNIADTMAEAFKKHIP